MISLTLTNKLLLCLRVGLTLLPFPGYLHPDEFFQSTEPMAKALLNVSSELTWEWTSTSPIRNLLHPLTSAGVPFYILKMLCNVFGFHCSAWWLLVLPRMFNLFVIYVMERCMLSIWSETSGRRSGDAELILFKFRSSYISLVVLTRTFSNNMEAALLVVLLHVLSTYSRRKEKTKATLLVFFVVVGMIIASGFFVRPTFLAFSLYPVLFTFMSVVVTAKSIKTILMFAVTITMGACLSTICLIILDHAYYSSSSSSGGDMSWPLVVTPLNFLLYNTNSDNLGRHGFHPRYLHLVVNMVLLFGPMYLVLLYLLTSYVTRSVRTFSIRREENWRRWSKSSFLRGVAEGQLRSRFHMMLTVLVPVLILSLAPHQEPRFLLPVFVPLILCVMSTPISSSSSSRRSSVRVYTVAWLIFNLLCVLWFGFVHQGGVVKSLGYMNAHMRLTNYSRPTTLLYWHTYMAPTHLLAVPTDSVVTLRNLGGASFEIVKDIIISSSRRRGSYGEDIWLFCPSSFHDDVIKERFRLRTQFFPHVSTESIDATALFRLFKEASSISSFLANALSLNAYTFQGSDQNNVR